MHFKVHSKFFYSKLDNNEKRIYDKILDGWLNYKESITITGFNGKVDYKNIFRYIYDDHPELFYIDFNRVSVMHAPLATIVSMKTLYSATACEKIKKDISVVIEKVVNLCSNSLDKEKTIHDYLAQNVRYSSDVYSLEAHDVKGALLDGEAVCEGYARSFKLLCDAVEIPCIMIHGTATHSNGDSESHAWNIVRRRKNNYHVDVTWNRNTNNIPDIPLYYNLSDEYIEKDHTWEPRIWPKCMDSTEADKMIVPVIGKKRLQATIVNMAKNKKNIFAVRFNRKFSSTQEVVNVIASIISLCDVPVSSFSAVYHESLDCAVIRFVY